MQAWGTPYLASIMLITLTVDGWCVLPVFFPPCHRRSTNLNFIAYAGATDRRPWPAHRLTSDMSVHRKAHPKLQSTAFMV
jgi:hypothetical protein